MAKLYTADNNCRALKALIASKYSGKSVQTENVKGKTDSKKFFGKVPALEVSGGELFDSSAIAFYLANDNLRGKDELSKAQVFQFVNYADSEIHPAAYAWVLPALGLSNDKKTMESAKTEVKNILKLLNDYLLTRTYLVGDSVTLADISVCVALLPLYKHVLEASLRDSYVNVTRYFNTLIHQKEFASVLGEVELCTTAGAAPKAEKAKPQKSAPKPAVPPKEEAGDMGDDLLPAQPKQKDPFEKFPKGNFNMDDFKRFYSNNPESKSIPYFWEKFDKQNFSIWYCEYKYADELTMVFMSCNLISGMFQRLDKMRKNAFGSMILFGEDNNSTISGIWVWRGPELAFTLSEDWQIDYESYEWKKLDPDDPKTKTMVNEYFAWEGQFDGKKFNQGKIFK